MNIATTYLWRECSAYGHKTFEYEFCTCSQSKNYPIRTSSQIKTTFGLDNLVNENEACDQIFYDRWV